VQVGPSDLRHVQGSGSWHDDGRHPLLENRGQVGQLCRLAMGHLKCAFNAVLVCCSSCAAAPRPCPTRQDYLGMVADAETQLPVPGALVVAVWTLQSGSDYGNQSVSSSRKPSATRTGSIVAGLGAGPEAVGRNTRSIRSGHLDSQARLRGAAIMREQELRRTTDVMSTIRPTTARQSPVQYQGDMKRYSLSLSDMQRQLYECHHR